MKFVAITGSIGCGKTTLSNIVHSLGYTVYDVDGWVRRLYFQKDFIKTIARTFPEVMEAEKVNKRKLRTIVFGDNGQLKILEGLIHPFLKRTLKIIRRKNANKDDLFFLDVALLFEMGWDKYCDYIIVADVDYAIQKQRVMLRDGISGQDFENINKLQLNNEYKKILADAVINTDKPINLLRVDLLSLIDEIKDC